MTRIFLTAAAFAFASSAAYAHCTSMQSVRAADVDPAVVASVEEQQPVSAPAVTDEEQPQAELPASTEN